MGTLLLLGFFLSASVFGQTAPTPRPINPVLSVTGGSCGTLFAPCPAISRLGLFVWLSGQYLETGLGGNPHAATLGGFVDITMEVANRVAVSASIPGALNRIQGQNGEEVWGIGGPLEARARVRLGPASPSFYSIQVRPLWSSVIEVRTQFLIPGFDGDSKYVGRVQRGFVQPAVYGAGELNVWRLQLAPGAGILVGDREAHVDLSLRMSVQLLDRLFGDIEALRRQALAVPSEPGRCQSAWMAAAGLRFQLRRGVFLSARYVGGRGDCVPEHSFMMNLGLAFGEGFMRIPTPEESGFIKKWHATLMGMVDPVLDCQGIMRADDGTPMFRFGYVDPHTPSIVWRNHIAYRVGEHFWEKGGRLYRDTDLTHPVLDLYGEAPLTFAERAAMHDCPTLPGLGSPCQVAMNWSALRQKIGRGDSPVQVALAEDSQILACLNHVSPLKAAAMFTAIQAALGPAIAMLPQVARWSNPAEPSVPAPSAPAAVAQANAPPAQPSGPPKVAAPMHPTDYRGQSNRVPRKLGRPVKPAKADEPAIEPPHLPSLPGGSNADSSRAVAENPRPVAPSHQATDPRAASTAASNSSTRAPGQTPPSPTAAQNAPAANAEAKALQANQRPKSAAPASTDAAADPVGERASHEPEPAGPLCGTYCTLTVGAVSTGLLVAGGVEVTKDAVILGAVAGAESTGMSVAGVAGGALVGTIVTHGVAEHLHPPDISSSAAQPAEPPKNSPQPPAQSSEQSTDKTEGWLRQHEGPEGGATGPDEPNGHTLRKHVGLTDEQLVARQQAENVSGVSTYTDERAAEQVIQEAIRQNQTSIDEWVRQPYNGTKAKKILTYHGENQIGRGLTKSDPVIRPQTKAVVVLRRTPQGTYYVLTSYPAP
jgi:hypothetical protein